ncbi:MAG TPA: hypothetical protein PLP17_15815 [Oligoflexia bacterium]|nr:hypothetical protein [Oligoflexia bacterium]
MQRATIYLNRFGGINIEVCPLRRKDPKSYKIVVYQHDKKFPLWEGRIGGGSPVVCSEQYQQVQITGQNGTIFVRQAAAEEVGIAVAGSDRDAGLVAAALEIRSVGVNNGDIECSSVGSWIFT